MVSSAIPDTRRVYTERRAARAATKAGIDRRHRQIGTARLVGLALAGTLALGLIGGGGYPAWSVLTPLVAVFFLGVWLDRVEAARTRLERAIAFYDRGLARLGGRWAGTGATGTRYRPAGTHLYEADLDLFGDGSLFQRLCEARTRMGEATLAHWLLAPAAPDEIARRQAAVDELAGNLDLREDLAGLGADIGAGVDPPALRAWASQPHLTILPPPFVARGLTVAAALGLVALVVIALGAGRSLELPPVVMTTLRWYSLVTLGATAIVSIRFLRTAPRTSPAASAAAADLSRLAGILERLEREPFSSPGLAARRAALETGGEAPSRRIARLSRLVELIHSRRNMMAKVVWVVLAVDLQVAHGVERWRRTTGPGLGQWLDAIGEIEALASIAGYRFECRDHVWPEVGGKPPAYDATALAHPLLDHAVANDVRLDGDRQLLIVSGSNMSGKSTLLRTVGLNAVLAQAGAPVRAARLRMSPLAIGASIRITNSIQAGSSRFHAEITKLHMIIDAAATAPLLFLIDECLHGTNSRDRRVGAEAIVRALLERQALGLVTTHDLALTGITGAVGTGAANVHFVDHLTGGRLSFDYRMRPGIVPRSNALALMRAIGIAVPPAHS